MKAERSPDGFVLPGFGSVRKNGERFDVNDSGYIEKRELRHALRHYGLVVPETQVRAPGHRPTASPNSPWQ